VLTARSVRAALLAIALSGCDFDQAYSTWVAQHSDCPNASWLFCDGFEAPSLDPNTWTVQGTGGTILLDNTRAKRGKQSLHVHLDAATGASGQLQASQSVASPATQATLYLRAFFFIPASLAGTKIEFVQYQQPSAPFLGVFLQREEDASLSTVDYANTTAVYQKSNTTLSGDSWHCIEWETQASAGTSGGMSVWVDGSDAGLDISNALVLEPNPGLSVTQLGAIVPQMPAGAPVDIWFDELAMANVRIGCEL
jgi:hypothetical protein